MDYPHLLDQIIDAAGKMFPAESSTNFSTENGLAVLKNSDVFFTTSVYGMKAISHVIEDQAISLGGKFSFYSGFQKFSHFTPQQTRYDRLIETKNPIYVFGVPDQPLSNNENFYLVEIEPQTSLEEPGFARNWFVVLHNPQFVSMALVTRELPSLERPTGASNKLVYRNFEGFWTYNKEVINGVVEILNGYVKQRQGNTY